MGMIIRVKNNGKFEDVDIDFNELTAGELLEIIDKKSDDMIFELAYKMILVNNSPLFTSGEDAKQRISSKTLTELSDALLQQCGLTDDKKN